jgi:flavin-dependent dehydrogenase
MSLDLCGKLSWAWVLPGEKHIMFAVEQTLASLMEHSPPLLLRHWINVLRKHGVLRHPVELADDQIESIDIPFEGARAQEGLANRTLLVGPAGGFYSGCGEDVYPNCWSAIFAADVLKKSLKEPHLQDALQAYRYRWRTTLGDYLRGPQRNLRFLLPLVYRNQVMTDRLAEAILSGKSVVR